MTKFRLLKFPLKMLPVQHSVKEILPDSQILIHERPLDVNVSTCDFSKAKVLRVAPSLYVFLGDSLCILNTETKKDNWMTGMLLKKSQTNRERLSPVLNRFEAKTQKILKGADCIWGDLSATAFKVLKHSSDGKLKVYTFTIGTVEEELLDSIFSRDIEYLVDLPSEEFKKFIASTVEPYVPFHAHLTLFLSAFFASTGMAPFLNLCTYCNRPVPLYHKEGIHWITGITQQVVSMVNKKWKSILTLRKPFTKSKQCKLSYLTAFIKIVLRFTALSDDCQEIRICKQKLEIMQKRANLLLFLAENVPLKEEEEREITAASSSPSRVHNLNDSYAPEPLDLSLSNAEVNPVETIDVKEKAKENYNILFTLRQEYDRIRNTSEYLFIHFNLLFNMYCFVKFNY